MAITLTAERVFDAARDGDSHALRVVDQVATRLADLIATVLALFDPELIVVGGGVGQNLDLMEAMTRNALEILTPMKPTLAVGTLGPGAVVCGAITTGISIAREAVFRERIERAD